MTKANRPKLTMLKPRLAMLPAQLANSPKPLSARSLRWSGRKLQELRERILSQEPLCRPCRLAGRTAAADHVDHIVPLEAGGTYEDGNLQPICTECHKEKTARERGYASANLEAGR
jgi:5-methylcytosine-specific restriction endonuclease McrA